MIYYKWGYLDYCLKPQADGMGFALERQNALLPQRAGDDPGLRAAAAGAAQPHPAASAPRREVIADEFGEYIPSGANPMLVASNSSRFLGASIILFESMLNLAAKSLREDLFVIPSSIHEVLLVPASYADAKTLKAVSYTHLDVYKRQRIHPGTLIKKGDMARKNITNLCRWIESKPCP